MNCTGDGTGMADERDDDLFEESFAEAFRTGPAGFPDPEDERPGGDGRGAIARLETGIDGLDGMIRGGIPERSLLAVVGRAGVGKSIFGMQFLHRGLVGGDNCIYVTLEQTGRAIVTTGEQLGWNFEEYVADDAGANLGIVDVDPLEMKRNIDTIRRELPRVVQDFGASRVVVDSISLVETMYDDAARRRSELYGFTQSMKTAGATTLLTSEASKDPGTGSKFGFVEHLTDAIFNLRFVQTSDHQATRLAIEVQKIRDTEFTRETKPYEITDEGIQVFEHASVF